MAEKRRLDLILSAVDRLSGPLGRVNHRLNELNAPINRARRNLVAFGRASGLAGLSRAIGRVAAAVRNLAFVAGAAAVAGGAMLLRWIGVGDQVAKTSAAIDISAEALQEWRFAADRMGVTREETDKGLLRFARTLGEVKLGTGALTTILKANAPALLAQFRAVKNTDEGLELLIDSLSKVSNQNVKVALTQAAFGRSGIKLAKLLTAPREEIDALRQRARDLGLVISDETAAAAEEAQDRFTDFKASLQGLWNTIASELLPSVTELLRRMTDWIVANRGVISSSLVPAIHDAAVAVAELARELLPAIRMLSRLAHAIGGVRTVLIALGVLFAVVLGPPLVALIGALLSPVGLVIAGIAAIVGLAIALRKQWQPIGDFFEALWARIQPPEWLLAGIAGLRSLLPTLGPLGLAADVALAGAGKASSVSGQIGVKIESDRPAAVQEVSASRGLELDVETGPGGLAFAG